MDLIQYPDIGGYHPDPAKSKWATGSIFENEGQRLYDLVIKHKPLLVVEVGAFQGCSTTWIASALRANGIGKIITIDINSGAWSKVPKELYEDILFWNEDALTCNVPPNIDILFEDGAHTTGFTKSILQRFKAKIVVCHDYEHWDCIKTVKGEFREVLGEPDEVFYEPPSDCGLGIKYCS